MTSPYYTDDAVTLYLGDCREILAIARRLSAGMLLQHAQPGAF